MELQTKIKLQPAKNQIDYKSHILILGSCFAENIGSKFKYFKFQSLQNPLGILFHSKAIEKLIVKAIRNEKYTAEDIFFFNERWHCFDVHSDLSNTSKDKMLADLNKALESVYQQLIKATHICITIGTAWVYRKKTSEAIVANCHKVPQKEFEKELLSIAEIASNLERIIAEVRSVNTRADFIFTVSPVRHIKDGFVENQRSKSHIITALHQVLSIQKEAGNCSYFPSYELMMDELRDYRFYESDMVHPSILAIDYIWHKFIDVWVCTEAIATMKKVAVIQKGIQHRPFNAKSEKHQLFLKSLQEKITYLQQEHSYMQFHT